MSEIEKFSIEIIRELEKKFKNACCNKTAEAYLDAALLVKHAMKKYQKGQNNTAVH